MATIRFDQKVTFYYIAHLIHKYNEGLKVDKRKDDSLIVNDERGNEYARILLGTYNDIDWQYDFDVVIRFPKTENQKMVTNQFIETLNKFNDDFVFYVKFE